MRDIGEGRTKGFVRDQFLICANVFAAPLWMLGLVSFCRHPRLIDRPGACPR